MPSTPSSVPSDPDRPPSRRARWILVAVALTLVAAVAAVTAYAIVDNSNGGNGTSVVGTLPSLSGDVSVPGVAVAGDLAPDFTLHTLDGKTVSLHDYLGQPIVVNFWASYCNPCRKEFPALRRALAARPGQFVVLGVDFKDIPSDARAFARQQHATWPVLEDADNAVATAYGVRAVPQTFFIGRDGRIAQRYYAQIPSERLARELQKIIEPAPSPTAR